MKFVILTICTTTFKRVEIITTISITISTKWSGLYFLYCTVVNRNNFWLKIKKKKLKYL